MAKIIGQLFDLSGTLGNEVYVRMRNGKSYVRRRPRPGCKRNEPGVKQHYTRARRLNNLAGGINSILKTESGGLKHGEFYFELLSRFRKQTSDNRFLLLTSLSGMDIHPRYTLSGLTGDQEIMVKPGKKKINVTLTVKYHPRESPRTNCYCYEVLLLTWTQRAKTPGYSYRVSEWLYPDKDKLKFKFSFKNEGDIVHWMLCLKKSMGFNDKHVSVKLEGMRIMQVGTYDKKDIALLKKNAEEEKKKKSSLRKEEVGVVRVKGEKIN
jgi:hypothetical protein